MMGVESMGRRTHYRPALKIQRATAQLVPKTDIWSWINLCHQHWLHGITAPAWRGFKYELESHLHSVLERDHLLWELVVFFVLQRMETRAIATSVNIWVIHLAFHQALSEKRSSLVHDCRDNGQTPSACSMTSCIQVLNNHSENTRGG